MLPAGDVAPPRGGGHAVSTASLAKRAQEVMPGGVSSPVRAHVAVGGDPFFIRKGQGAWVEDEAGQRYVDFIGGYGPYILGHRHPAVMEALSHTLEDGLSFGACHTLEATLALQIGQRVPSMEMVRFVCSGTEATMSAVRLARGVTRRPGIVIFEGGYHGHSDALLAGRGSGMATLGIPASPGVTPGATADTHVIAYNDIEALERLMEDRGATIAAILIEPVAGNMGCVPPAKGYLQEVISLAHTCGALVVFDEVMTGFRVARGGAQDLYGLTPDLTCVGKVVGGGMPLAAYGGRRDLMEHIAPSGAIYQAGTLSGHPLALAAGVATLEALTNDVYATLEARGAQFEEGVKVALETTYGVGCVNRVGSMLTIFPGLDEVTSFDTAARVDRPAFSQLHQQWRDHEVMWPPSPLECGFISAAHTAADIDKAIDGVAHVAHTWPKG